MRHALCDMRLVSCCTGVKSVPICSVVDDIARRCKVLQYFAVFGTVLQGVALCFRVLQGVAGCCNVVDEIARTLSGTVPHVL